MIAGYLVTTLGLAGHNAVGNTATYNQPLIIPEGYAFSIWGLIYLGLIIFPFYQWSQRKTGDRRWLKVRSLYTVNVILNGLWLVFASYDWLICTVLTIVPMLYTLYRINVLLGEMKNDGIFVNGLFEKFVFSVYFGWITLATVLNVAAALNYYDWQGMGLSQITWAYIMIPVAAVIAAITARKFRDNAYAGVVIWAFAALVVRHYSAEPSLAIMSAAVIATFLLLILVNLRENAYRRLSMEL